MLKSRREGLVSGSTACMVLVQRRKMFVFNLGDSRAVMLAVGETVIC